MKFVDRLIAWRKPAPADPVQDEADFKFPNRATRRKAGIRFPIGLLTDKHVGLVVEYEPYLPRYVRRHWAQYQSDHSRRRNRKVRARIARAMSPIAGGVAK